MDTVRLIALIRSTGERHGLSWEPDCSARSMLAKLGNKITLLERRQEQAQARIRELEADLARCRKEIDYLVNG